MSCLKQFFFAFLLALLASAAWAADSLQTYVEGKPAYFVDYLSIDGTDRPRIDTGYVFKKEPRLVARFKADEDWYADVAGMPLYNAVGSFNIWLNVKNSPLRIQYWYGQEAGSVGTNLYFGADTVANVGSLFKWATLDLGREVYLNGRLIGRVDTFDFSQNEQTFSLFSGRTDANCKSCWGETWLYDGGVLVRHLKPGVTSDNKPCMYDTITDCCYINVGNTYQGEGKLKANGAKWREGAPQKFVEYLSADSGNCEVNTGYAFTDRPRVHAWVKVMTKNDVDICGATGKTGFIVNFCEKSSSHTRAVWSHYSDSTKALVEPYTCDVVNAWIEGDFSDQMYLTMTNGTVNRGTCSLPGMSANTLPFRLFAGRNQPQVAFKAVELYDGLDEGGNWKLVMYLKPAIDDEGEPCYYDTLSNRRFYNTGTGALTAGPDLPDAVPPATLLDWVGEGDASGHDVDTGYAFVRQPLVKTSVYVAENWNRDVAGTPNEQNGCFIVNLDFSLGKYYYRYGSSSSNTFNMEDKLPGQWTDFIWGPKVVHDHGRFLSADYSGGKDFTGNTQTFHLFKGRTSAAGLRFRRTQMYDGFVLSDSAKAGRQTFVRDLAPAKDANGVACFYDFVEGKYYYTKKSGSTLQAGPELAKCTDVKTFQTRDRKKLTKDYSLVSECRVRLKDVTGASAESEVSRISGVATCCFLEDDPENQNERTVQFQQFEGTTVAATLIRLKDDGTNIWAKVEAQGSYAAATEGPVVAGYYNLRTQPEKFTSTAGLEVRGLTLWHSKSEMLVDATVDGFQATVEDGGTVRLDGETATMSGWLAGHGDARLGTGAAWAETPVVVTLSETAQTIAEATPLYAVSPVDWTETASGTTRTFEKDGAVIKLSQSGEDVCAVLVSGTAPASLTLAKPTLCVTDFSVVNSLVGELIVDGAYAKFPTTRVLAPNTGTLVIRAGGVCDLPDWNLADDANGIGHELQSNEGQRILVEKGGRLVLRSKNISPRTPVEIRGGEMTCLANDGERNHRLRINNLTLSDGAKVTGDGTIYIGANLKEVSVLSCGTTANEIRVPMIFGGFDYGNTPIRMFVDTDLLISGAVSKYTSGSTALIKLGPATLTLATELKSSVPLQVEEGAVRLSANQSVVNGLTLAGAGLSVDAGVSAKYGALTISGANTISLGAGASLTVSSLASWAEGTTISVVADDPTNIALKLPTLSAEQLAAITVACDQPQRWRTKQDAEGNVRFALLKGVIIVVR